MRSRAPRRVGRVVNLVRASTGGDDAGSVENNMPVSRSWRSLGRAVGRDVFVLLAIGGLYYASAQLGLKLSLVYDAVTPLWPPTGVAVVAFFAFRSRVWPAVAVAALLVNLPITPNWWA